MSEVECDCYPGGFTPDSYEGFQEHCKVHGVTDHQGTVPGDDAEVVHVALLLVAKSNELKPHPHDWRDYGRTHRRTVTTIRTPDGAVWTRTGPWTPADTTGGEN